MGELPTFDEDLGLPLAPDKVAVVGSSARVVRALCERLKPLRCGGGASLQPAARFRAFEPHCGTGKPTKTSLA